MAEPTLFVDADLIDDILAVVDQRRALDGVALRHDLAGTPEDHCLRVRGSLWLAMALDDVTTTTASQRQPVRSARLGTWGAAWLAGWSAFVRPRVCPAWTATTLAPGVSSRADLAAACAARAWPLVTRDGRLATAARGLSSFAPEHFAAMFLPLVDARTRFFERFDQHSLARASARAGATRDALEREAIQLGQLRNLYAYIWRDRPGD